jgi:serine/threonine protein phosphatase PrpC
MIKPDLRFETAAITHTGLVREVNEDSVFTSAKHGIWLVADGMGGHRDGGIASSMVTEAAATFANESNHGLTFLEQMKRVNAKLLERSNGHLDSIVGTTVNALIVEGTHFFCLWAGDSRCYLIRNGKLSQISQDHTEVQELVNSGVISTEEAKTWPRRNVITRAVGVHNKLDMDLAEGEIQAGDCFVLCSDGLTGHVSDAEILSHVIWSSPQFACDRLLALALERGGKDNISIIVLRAAKPDKTQLLDPDWHQQQGHLNDR